MNNKQTALFGIDEEVDSILKKCHNSTFDKNECEQALKDKRLSDAQRRAIEAIANFMERGEKEIVGATITKNGEKVGKIARQSGGFFKFQWKSELVSSGKTYWWTSQKKPKTYEKAVDLFFVSQTDYKKNSCTVEPYYGVVFDYYKWQGRADAPLFKIGDKVKYVGAEYNWYTANGSVWEIRNVHKKNGIYKYDAATEKAGLVRGFEESSFVLATAADIENWQKQIEGESRKLPHRFKQGDMVRYQDSGKDVVGHILSFDNRHNQYIVSNPDGWTRQLLEHELQPATTETDEAKARRIRIAEAEAEAALALLELVKIGNEPKFKRGDKVYIKFPNKPTMYGKIEYYNTVSKKYGVKGKNGDIFLFAEDKINLQTNNKQ